MSVNESKGKFIPVKIDTSCNYAMRPEHITTQRSEIRNEGIRMQDKYLKTLICWDVASIPLHTYVPIVIIVVGNTSEQNGNDACLPRNLLYN